jgi:hypothetical protein
MELEATQLQLNLIVAEKSAKIQKLEKTISEMSNELYKNINVKYFDGLVISNDVTELLQNPDTNIFRKRNQYWDSIDVKALHLKQEDIDDIVNDLKNLLGRRNISRMLKEKYNCFIESIETNYVKPTTEMLETFVQCVRKRKLMDLDHEKIIACTYRSIKLEIKPVIELCKSE